MKKEMTFDEQLNNLNKTITLFSGCFCISLLISLCTLNIEVINNVFITTGDYIYICLLFEILLLTFVLVGILRFLNKIKRKDI